MKWSYKASVRTFCSLEQIYFSLYANIRKSISNINRFYKTNEGESTSWKSIHEHICCLQKKKKKNKHAQQRTILAQTEMAAGAEFPPPTHKNPEAFNTRRGMGPLPGQTLGNVQHQLEHPCIQGPRVGQLHFTGSHNNSCPDENTPSFSCCRRFKAHSYGGATLVMSPGSRMLDLCMLYTPPHMFFPTWGKAWKYNRVHKHSAKWSVLMINRHVRLLPL